MALTNDQITAQNFKDFYTQILPYLNGGNYVEKSVTEGLLKNDGTVDTTISGAVSANTSAISGIKDGQSIDSFADVEAALANLPSGGNKVIQLDAVAATSGVTGNKFGVNVSEVPQVSVGDIVVLSLHNNYTFSGSSGEGWGFTFNVSGTTTNWDNNIFRNWAGITQTQGSFTTVMKENLSCGIVLTMVCFGFFSTTPQFLLISKETAAPMSQTATLSTSSQTTVTFTRDDITTDSVVEVGISEWGLIPDDVTVSSGSCTVTLPIVDSAHTVTVRLYVR